MKYYKIDENTVKGLLQYLAERPYKEVAQGINSLITLEELKETKKDEIKTPKT